MPEVILKQENDHGKGKETVSAAKKKPKYETNWLHLPLEVWLSVLIEYGLTARDLANLELVCRWFGWKGN